ncbi:MAG: hypothetical protein OHK0013_07740 [Sandaracinaceae bacterium]
MSIAAWLRAQGAAHDVVAWAESFGDDAESFWDACPRGDWLLAIAARAGVGAALVARAAAEVAVLARDLLPDDDTLAREVLDALLRRARGEGSGPDDAALRALEASVDHAPDPVVQLARSAIVVAAGSAQRPEDASVVAGMLAQAAALDAADCGMHAAVSYAQRKSAAIVRAIVPRPRLDGTPS